MIRESRCCSALTWANSSSCCCSLPAQPRRIHIGKEAEAVERLLTMFSVQRFPRFACHHCCIPSIHYPLRCHAPACAPSRCSLMRFVFVTFFSILLCASLFHVLFYILSLFMQSAAFHAPLAARRPPLATWKQSGAAQSKQCCNAAWLPSPNKLETATTTFHVHIAIFHF